MIFLILHLFLVISFTLRILLRDDLSPSARLAWFVVIFVLPYFGIFVYFMFGEVDLGHKLDQRHAAVFNKIHSKAKSVMGDASITTDEIVLPYQSAFSYSASINGFNAVSGNRAELIEDDHQARERLIADIDAAKFEVNVLYYIWLNDDTGRNVGEALIRALNRGVTCRAMVDGLGSRDFIKSDLWQNMADAGVQTSVALPIEPLWKTILFSRLDLRNHRKITVIDQQISYCGSQNCAEYHFPPKPKYAPWIDIMLRVEGPVVAQNQLLFASDWLMHNPDTPLETFIYEPEFHENGFPASIMGDGPTIRKAATPQLFSHLMTSAQTEVVISTPYFVPDAVVLNSLISASVRGIDVSLILPKRNDSWIVAAASRAFYPQLLKAGVKIYEYTPGLLHAKTLTIDKKVSFIGSTNLDLRSFDLNYENNILLQDADITTAIHERQQSYISDAEMVSIDKVERWSVFTRLKQNIIATIGPVL